MVSACAGSIDASALACAMSVVMMCGVGSCVWGAASEPEWQGIVEGGIEGRGCGRVVESADRHWAAQHASGVLWPISLCPVAPTRIP